MERPDQTTVILNLKFIAIFNVHNILKQAITHQYAFHKRSIFKLSCYLRKISFANRHLYSQNQN